MRESLDGVGPPRSLPADPYDWAVARFVQRAV